MHPAEYKRKRVRDIGGRPHYDFLKGAMKSERQPKCSCGLCGFVSETGKYFDVLRIICHTEKKRRNGVTPEQMISSTGFWDDVTV